MSVRAVAAFVAGAVDVGFADKELVCADYVAVGTELHSCLAAESLHGDWMQARVQRWTSEIDVRKRQG
jgi:hypothetical protein